MTYVTHQCFSCNITELTSYFRAKDESNPIPETCTANMTIIIADVDGNAQNSIASINDSTIILPVELKVNIPDNTNGGTFVASAKTFPVSDSDKRNLGEIDVYSYGNVFKLFTKIIVYCYCVIFRFHCSKGLIHFLCV